MKLLITIVQNDDVTALLEAIVESGHSATKLSSSGGLLRNGNTTLLIGIEDSDVDEIKAAKSKLETSAQKVFSAMYENMQQAQAGAGAGPEPQADTASDSASAGSAGDAGDDVVDADYREV